MHKVWRGDLLGWVPVNGAVVLNWSSDTRARHCTAGEKTRFLRNPRHTKVEIQSTLLYFTSDIIHNLLCSNSQPRGPLSLLTPCVQPTHRVRGAELGLWDSPPSALSLPWIHITLSSTEK